MAIQKDVTVYIGRFSPFHKGHAHVLRRALETSKLVVVLVGSAGQARSLKNPFSFEERKEMIYGWESTQRSCDLQSRLIVMPLRDYPYSDTQWIAEVQRTVAEALAGYSTKNPWAENLTDIYLTGSDRDESTWYLKSFPQWKQDLSEPYRPYAMEFEVSATNVRRWLLDSSVSCGELDYVPDILPITTLNFLQDFMDTPEYEQLKSEYSFVVKYKKAWEAAPYAPTFNTADAVVIQSGHVLVVERGAEPGKGLWAVPGGFINQSERIEDAAIRELIEETGIRLADGKKGAEITRSMLKGSIKAKEIFDDPGRSSRGRTITVAYLFKLDDTKPLPKVRGLDDAAKAFWIPLDKALSQTHMWFEDHWTIVDTMSKIKD